MKWVSGRLIQIYILLDPNIESDRNMKFEEGHWFVNELIRTVSDGMKAVSKPYRAVFVCVFFNVNFGNELIRTVSNGMKAVCKPYWAVWQESDQPGDTDRNLRIRDRPEIWWDMIRYDKIWWDMSRYDEIWWLHDEIWLIGEIWWVTSQVMGIVVLIGDGWAD